VYILFCSMLTFIRFKRIVYKIVSLLYQVCTNPRRQCTRAIKLVWWRLMCLGPQYGTFLHVTHLAPRILSWLLNFGKFVHPLCLFNTWPTTFRSFTYFGTAIMCASYWNYIEEINCTKFTIGMPVHLTNFLYGSACK
jgi:hypothetical protein